MGESQPTRIDMLSLIVVAVCAFIENIWWRLGVALIGSGTLVYISSASRIQQAERLGFDHGISTTSIVLNTLFWTAIAMAAGFIADRVIYRRRKS